MSCGPVSSVKIEPNYMILELAVLNVIPEKTVEFEASFEKAQKSILNMDLLKKG
jgi:hypothetical protein